MKQIDLIPEKGAHVEPVTPELIARVRRRPTLIRAIHLAAEISDLEPKKIYSELDLDKASYSRMCDGKAWLPQDERFTRFMDVVRNEIPLIYLCEARGYDFTTLRKHHSTDLERENERLRQELADRDRALGLIISHHRSRQP